MKALNFPCLLFKIAFKIPLFSTSHAIITTSVQIAIINNKVSAYINDIVNKFFIFEAD